MDQETFALITGNTKEFQRQLLEKSLAMRAQAYQSQIKAKLLTQAIMQIENSKKNLQTLNETLASEIAARKKVEEKIRYMASHDELTGLPNRALFQDRLKTSLNLAVRYKHKLAIMFIDLDGFKAINDSLGHKAGDLLLQEVARRLQATVRVSDTVARMGGDEFIVLLNNVESAEDAEPVAKKILASFGQPIMLANHGAEIGGSIGISIFPDHGSDTDKLISNADAAMYDIKKTGKNSYAFYTP